MNVTASMAFRLVLDSLRTQPVFLCIDDTIVPKSGTKFEDVSILFDHAAHRDSSYLNGHCFISLMLCVPVWKADKISWLSVPLGYRMWTKQKSKLELAADMIRQDMGNSSPSKQILFFLMKRWTVILSPSALLSQICLAAGRYWHMSLPRNREVKKRNFFSVRFFRSSCRFSLPGRRRHP